MNETAARVEFDRAVNPAFGHALGSRRGDVVTAALIELMRTIDAEHGPVCSPVTTAVDAVTMETA